MGGVPTTPRPKAPPLGSSICSGCDKEEPTVDRYMFDGLCADCTTRALYDDEFRNKSYIKNRELIGRLQNRR